MLDLNILTFRMPEYVTPFPTLVQTGTESFHLVRSASMGAQRVSTYSESSVNPQDMAFLASANAVSVKTQWTPEGMHARAGTSFILRLPSDVGEITVNGMPMMPHRDNRYFIPSGEHAITFRRTMENVLSAHVLHPRVMSATGTVTALSYGTRSITMTYESAVRMLVTISAIPARLTVDGADTPFAVMKGNECFSVFLPTGGHTAVIEVGGDFEYGVTVTSFWSSTVIALFGLGAVTTLAGMFVVLKILKRRGSFTHA
jgi:hypothetical protein